MPVRHPAGAQHLATVAVVLLALLLAPGLANAASNNPLNDFFMVRELLSQGEYERALELAQRVANQQSGFLFRNLPTQVLAERILSQGDPSAALEHYRRLTPAGGCLVSYHPTYWNSCERMAELYSGVGDRAGRIDMLRRLSFGADTRGSSSASRTYLQLSTAR